MQVKLLKVSDWLFSHRQWKSWPPENTIEASGMAMFKCCLSKGG